MLGFFSAADATIIVAVVTLVATPLISLAYSAKKTRRGVDQINNAVNHVGVDEPTLIQRVRDIQLDNHEFRQWTHTAMNRIASEVGAQLDPPPAPRGHDGSDEHPVKP